jgi:hypothetical protein
MEETAVITIPYSQLPSTSQNNHQDKAFGVARMSFGMRLQQKYVKQGRHNPWRIFFLTNPKTGCMVRL